MKVAGGDIEVRATAFSRATDGSLAVQDDTGNWLYIEVPESVLASLFDTVRKWQSD